MHISINQQAWEWLYKSVKGKYEVPCFLSLLLSIWPKLASDYHLDCHTEAGVLGLIAWWEGQRSEYPGVSWPNDNIFPSLLYEHDTQIQQDGFLPITKGLMAIWRVREDLQKNYPLDTRESRNDFIFWWLDSGVRQYRFLFFTPLLYAPAIEVQQDAILPITNGLLAVWNIRPDLQERFPIDTTAGRQELVDWWLNSGVRYYRFLLFTPLLYAPATEMRQDATSPITNSLLAVWNIRPDLQKAFPIGTAAGRQALVDWRQKHGVQEYELLHSEKAPSPVNTPELSAMPSSFGSYQSHGVNVTGFPKGVLGLGEDVRMAAASLSTAAIAFSVFNMPITLGAAISATDVDHHIQQEPVYATNLFCLPGPVTYQLMLRVGSRYFDGRYNIGAWQWELPHWPEYWKPLFNLVQEIWAFSRYAETMYRASTSVPVYHMPLAVELPDVAAITRKDLTLPSDRFLFLVMFDGNSWLKRKNPMAAVHAFVSAFPKHRQDVGLVVKAMNVDEKQPDWRALKAIAAHDPRIIIKNEILARAETAGLIHCCDAYVSLHRAEGFGRIMAEAMLLGKPVIATNFSGNTDFTTPQTAYMVDGPMIPLQQGDYSEWEGQFWCEPDIQQAVAQMIACVEKGTQRALIASAGQTHIRTYHSAEAVGVLYKQRLRATGILS